MKRNSIERARAWRDSNARNYAAYQWFLAKAQGYAQKGERFSVKLLAEEYRWFTRSLADKQGFFKIDNSLVTPLGRLLIQDAPEIEKYMDIRKAYCDMEESCA